jgi:hypothetical protein
VQILTIELGMDRMKRQNKWVNTPAPTGPFEEKKYIVRPKFSLLTLLSASVALGSCIVAYMTWPAWYLGHVASYDHNEDKYYEKIDGPKSSPDGKRVVRIVNDKRQPYVWPDKPLLVMEYNGSIIAEFDSSPHGLPYVQFKDDNTLIIKDRDPENEWNVRFRTYIRRRIEGTIGHFLSFEFWLFVISIIILLRTCFSDLKTMWFQPVTAATAQETVKQNIERENTGD